MIILMGPVGSGKSEQTKRLAARLKVDTISTSQLLRDNLTPGREAKMLAGDLVDDSEVIELLKPALKAKHDSGADFILDGFPRSIPQAEWLVSQIKTGQVRLKAVIKLDVSDKAVLTRLLARGRADDTKDIIAHRLKVYHQTTNPIVKYMRTQGISVHQIAGEQPPDVIEAQINRIISQ